jgi:hypothetical protein
MDRLLTDLTMVPVWETVSAVPNDPRLPTDFLDEARALPRRWNAMPKATAGELNAELKKLGRKARELAELLLEAEGKILDGRGILELGPLIRAAQGHGYLYGLDVEPIDDPHERELAAEFNPEHVCPIYPLARAAAILYDHGKKLQLPDEWLFEPPTCPRPELNPLTREADGNLPSVVKLLEALGDWLETFSVGKGANPRPGQVHQENADRRFMARALSPLFRKRLGQPHDNLVATTIRVVLNIGMNDEYGESNVRRAVTPQSRQPRSTKAAPEED